MAWAAESGGGPQSASNCDPGRTRRRLIMPIRYFPYARRSIPNPVMDDHSYPVGRISISNVSVDTTPVIAAAINFLADMINQEEPHNRDYVLERVLREIYNKVHARNARNN